MKVIGIFRSYDDIEAAILAMSDLGITSRNVSISGFSDTDFNSEYAKELTALNSSLVSDLESRTSSTEYNPMSNKLFAAGAALITATESVGGDLFATPPDGGAYECGSFDAFTGDNKIGSRQYNKFNATFFCPNRKIGAAVSQKLRNCGAEHVFTEDI